MSMTLEEAIAEIKYYMESDSYADAPSNEACQMAINALRPVSREQVEKVWRSFWEQGDIYDFGDVCQKCGYDSGNEPCRMSFCPACGAPMTDEAVEMVMERMNKLYD